jgi:hypothetical protein
VSLVQYEEIADEPSEPGVYACRVRGDFPPPLLTDIFLMWDGKRWSYLGSDQFYRGQVYGFLGPLARTRA